MAHDDEIPLDIDLSAFHDEAPTRRDSSSDLFARTSERRIQRERVEELVGAHFPDVLPLDRVPIYAISTADLAWLDKDREAARLVAHVDGVSALRFILADADLPPVSAMRAMRRLVERGVVRFS